MKPIARASLIDALIPALFVPLWSTGFIGAKLGLPYAEPYTFLFMRYAAVAVLLGGVALLMRAPWPRTAKEWLHITVAGLLVHAVYISCVFDSIYHGLPSGVSALIVGLQPLLTAAVVGPLLGERVGLRQWLGLLLGLIGVALVLWEKVSLDVGVWAVGLSVIALLGISIGTVYQKRFCPRLDLRSGVAIQYCATAIYVGIFALTLETRHVEWSGRFIFALVWLMLVLSIGAVSLLFILLRRGTASRTAALFYLVPPCTALVAWLLFDEQLGVVALLGMAIAAAGVFLATRPANDAAPVNLVDAA
ncbi:MAG: DMT family transporter [Rhodospirillales bacterium]